MISGFSGQGLRGSGIVPPNQLRGLRGFGIVPPKAVPVLFPEKASRATRFRYQRSSACAMFFADVETVIILRERADAVTAGVLSKEALLFLCSHQY